MRLDGSSYLSAGRASDPPPWAAFLLSTAPEGTPKDSDLWVPALHFPRALLQVDIEQFLLDQSPITFSMRPHLDSVVYVHYPPDGYTGPR